MCFSGSVFSEHCPEDWIQLKSQRRVASLQKQEEYPKVIECIRQFDEKTSWHRAKRICISKKAKLLEITTHHKSQEVKKHANSKFFI